ncbi:MAG: glycosyltransferase family 39 protein [Anaerolineae bacterium]|nr:glycosyltransferase family 39 protein [Anaerolineae bacterium]
MHRNRRTAKFIVTLLTLVAFALRVYHLDRQSYWIDEAWTLFYADQSLGELWLYLQTIRAAPPLYHVLTIYWVDWLGNGEYALRFLSVITSTMAIPLIYRLGQTLGGRRLGLVVALLMTVAPYQIWHAQDARNYSMLTAASIMSMWAFFNLWQRGDWRWWLLYVLSTLWAIFTHYHGLVVIGIQGLYFLLTVRQNWRFYLPWAGTLLVIMAPFVVWLTVGSTLWQSDHWLPFVGLWDSYLRSAKAYSINELVPQPQATYLTLVFVIFYGFGLLYAARRYGWNLLALLLVFTLAPNIATWLYSQIGTPVYLERYLIAVQVGYLLTVALGILAVADWVAGWQGRKVAGWQGGKVAGSQGGKVTELQSYRVVELQGGRVTEKSSISTTSPSPNLQSPVSSLQLPITNFLLFLLLLPFLAISLFVLSHHYSDPVYAKPNWRGVIEMIETYSQPGDAILMTGDGGEKLFDFYYRGDLPIYHDFNTPVPPPDAARQRIAEIAAEHKRLWYTPYGVDIDATLENWLAEHSYPAWQSWLGRKRLALYSLTAPEMTHAINARFIDADGHGVTLNSITLPVQPTAAGDLLPLSLEWQTDAPLTQNIQLSLRLINNFGDTFTQSDWPPLTATQPTTTWPLAQPITDHRSLWIPADTPPGDYLLQYVIYDPASGQALGQPHTMAGIAVDPADIVVPVAALSIPNYAARPLADMTLLGYAAPEKIQPGQEMWLWLYWQPNHPLNPKTQIRLQLEAGEVQSTADFSLVADSEDVAAWQPGQVRRTVYHLPTNPRLDGTTAHLTVALLDAAGAIEAETSVTEIALETRRHQFDSPDIETPLEVNFGNPTEITLLGSTISTDSLEDVAVSDQPSTIRLTLYWQAQQEMETNYTIFIQLLNPAGQVVAQVDQQPLAGAAPTTTWLSGEILTDNYTLAPSAPLQAGDYQLIAGFYNAATGERLPVDGGGDFVALGQLPVQ